MKHTCLLLLMCCVPVGACQPKPITVETLRPEHIQESFSTVLDEIKRCHDEYRKAGLVDIRFTVAGTTGRVVEALVVGDFADTPTGQCIQDIVVNMEFPRFEERYTRRNFSIILK